MSVTQTAAFRHLVREHMSGAPVRARPGSPSGDVLARMVAAGASGIVVVDAAGRPLGIVTEQDVSRRLAFRLPPETAIDAVMSAPVESIREDDPLYHAIARMRRAGRHHMPVVDRTGALAGMLHLDQALAAASGPLVGLIDRLTHEESFAGLAGVKAAEVELAAQLFADAVPAPEIQRLLTHINNDLYRRCDRLCRAAMRAEGKGEPPAAYAFLVMGSGGRGESYLNPDQDNGLILADYPDERHGEVDGWFRDYAARLTTEMDRIGMPLCRGYVMAVNPLWRKSASQWHAQIDYWIRRRNPATLRLADIFFDFRAVFGELGLAERLRQHVTARLRDNLAFLQEMRRIDEDHGVALGLFNRFVVERRDPERRGRMNLKLGGTLPLVNALRLLALRHGVAETSSLGRIAALRAGGQLSADEADDLTGAFGHITALMLEHQIAQFQDAGKTDSFIDPRRLSRRKRELLVDSLKAVRRLAQRVRTELTGDPF